MLQATSPIRTPRLTGGTGGRSRIIGLEDDTSGSPYSAAPSPVSGLINTVAPQDRA